jgi:hypothetical protein
MPALHPICRPAPCYGARPCGPAGRCSAWSAAAARSPQERPLGGGTPGKGRAGLGKDVRSVILIIIIIINIISIIIINSRRCTMQQAMPGSAPRAA